VVRVDDVVADLEIDVDDLSLDLEFLDVNGCLGNRVLLQLRSVCRTDGGSSVQVCR